MMPLHDYEEILHNQSQWNRLRISSAPFLWHLSETPKKRHQANLRHKYTIKKVQQAAFQDSEENQV